MLLHPRHAAELAGTAEPDDGDARQAPDRAAGHAHRPQGEPAWNAAGRLVEPFPLDRSRPAGRSERDDQRRADGRGHRRPAAELERHGDVPDDIHIMVPFNLRPLDQPLPRDLGNDFGLILLALPVGIEDRGALRGSRCAWTRSRTRTRVRSPTASSAPSAPRRPRSRIA